MISPRMHLWALKLSAYEYDLVYRPGTTIPQADALSLPTGASPAIRPSAWRHNPYNATLGHVTCYLMWHSSRDKEGPCTLTSLLVDTKWLPNILWWWLSLTLLSTLHWVEPTWWLSIVGHPSGDSRSVPICNSYRITWRPSRDCTAKAVAHSRVWSPGIDKATEGSVKACADCMLSYHKPAKAPLHPWSRSPMVQTAHRLRHSNHGEDDFSYRGCSHQMDRRPCLFGVNIYYHYFWPEGLL